MVVTLEEVYKFVDDAIEAAKANGNPDVACKLEDAMHLGSSSLEILGAIRRVLLQEATQIDRWLSHSDRENVIQYVDRAFGMK